MIFKDSHLKNIIKGSSNFKHYYIKDYNKYNSIQDVEHHKVWDKLVRKEIEVRIVDDEELIENLSKIIKGFGEFFYNVSRTEKDNFTIIFKEYFAVCFEIDEEHLLYGYPYIIITLESFAIKEGKKYEDVESFLDIVQKLLKS